MTNETKLVSLVILQKDERSAVRMCENCGEFQALLYRVEREHEAALAASLTQDRLDAELQPELGKEDVMTSLTFLNTWHQKQCMCVFRDVKNLERFSLVVQCVTKISLTRLKDLPVSALRSPARMRLKVVMPGLPGWDVQASRRSLRSWRGRAECQQGGGQTCCRASTGKGFRQSHQ